MTLTSEKLYYVISRINQLFKYKKYIYILFSYLERDPGKSLVYWAWILCFHSNQGFIKTYLISELRGSCHAWTSHIPREQNFDFTKFKIIFTSKTSTWQVASGTFRFQGCVRMLWILCVNLCIQGEKTSYQIYFYI